MMTTNYQEPIIIDDNSSTSSDSSSSYCVSHGVTPDEYCNYAASNLTEYERQEIFQYPEVYFTGAINKKLNSRSPEEYDDNTGSYKWIPNDHIAYRYEFIKKLGSGSFGQVYKCYDHRDRKDVAVKIVRTPSKVARSAKIEIELLNQLSRHEPRCNNVIELLETFEFRRHHCLVFDLMGPSLYDYLKKTNFKGIIPSIVKVIADSVLLALNYLRNHNIIHCDLKPENILLCSNDVKQVKLIDFGSACKKGNQIYTYIQSRFYRAPEVLMGDAYDFPIDMWSFGCIIPELLTGFPIFPGEDSFDQMSVIMEVLGEPTIEYKRRGTKADKYFRKQTGRPLYCQRIINPDGRMGYKPCTTKTGKVRVLPGERTWRRVLRGRYDNQLVQFLKRILFYDANNRPTPMEAYEDSWLREPIEVITIDD